MKEEKIQENVRKVDLSNLPTFESLGKGGKGVDWFESIDMKIPFIYYDIIGELDIIDYNAKNQKITIRYKDEEKEIYSSNLLKCALGGLVKRTSPVRFKDFDYKVGQIIKTKSGKIEIIDRYRKKNKFDKSQKWYTYKCCIDGNISNICENSITRGEQGCNVCSGIKVLKGVNDLATTDPELISFLVNKEDGCRVSRKSMKKIDVVCPNCLNIKQVEVHVLTSKGIGCTKCGDGNSFPNKFISQILTEANIGHELEKTFSWIDRKRYDIYIPSMNCIIEAHGEQHYIDTKFGSSDNSGGLKYQIKNDKFKRNMAIKNGISLYYEIDCRKSTTEHILRSMEEASLLKMLNIKVEDIDLQKCELNAKTSKLIECCNLWKDGLHDFSAISKKLKVTKNTIGIYLAKGKELGICDYDKEKHMRDAGSKLGKAKAKKVKVFKNEQYLGEFESATYIQGISEEKFGTKLSSSMISYVCRGKQQEYKGYRFEFLKESA